MAKLQGNIKFTDSHRPALEDGDYVIEVTQSLLSTNTKKTLEQSISATFNFSIQGPRFTLDPQLIDGVFPPAGSLGDHSAVLPHILLNRSTLPWERSGLVGDKTEKKFPWLALLLFEEGELSTSAGAKDKAVMSTQTVSSLLSATSTNIKWPGIVLEIGQHGDDIVSVLDVPFSKLTAIIPSGEDLKLLAHVRQTEDALGKAEEELAVIIGNRLPKPGSSHIVHLVSVEGRYSQDEFNYQGAAEGDKIRLISLNSWRFACTKETNESFTGLASNLKPKLLQLQLLTEGSDAQNYANEHLNQGSAPLPHAMRQGNKSISWYHGPLVPGFNATKDFTLPIRSADDLVYFNKTYRVFDVSYAAAWELGRLLVLQNNRIATKLFHWKRSEARKQKNNNNAAELELTHLPFDGPQASLGLPDAVVSWFEHMRLLDGVPFHYLVPHEKMLPLESIRFFQVDPLWLECLLDGAFSIGRVSSKDHKQDSDFKNNPDNSVSLQRISGFLLRSDLVSGWPGLQIEGYDENLQANGFVIDKGKLLKELPLKFEAELNSKKLSTELKQEFTAKNSDPLTQQFAVENREWIICVQDQKKFKLLKRENNAIDVCDALDDGYIFSIDESLETELNGNTISPELIEAFQKQKLDLPPKSSVSVMTWYLTDHQQQKHYLIEKKTDRLEVYRHYKLPLLRMARLSGNILLCLFEGVVQTVDLHLKPETLHFGLNKNDKLFSKELRSLSNRPNVDPIDTIPWRNIEIDTKVVSLEEKRIIDISNLATIIQGHLNVTTFSSAEFALEMIAGSEKIRFFLPDK